MNNQMFAVLFHDVIISLPDVTCACILKGIGIAIYIRNQKEFLLVKTDNPSDCLKELLDVFPAMNKRISKTNDDEKDFISA